MSNLNLTDTEVQLAKGFVEKTAVPSIKKIVDEINKVLNTKGIQVGLELSWFFDRSDKENKTHGN